MTNRFSIACCCGGPPPATICFQVTTCSGGGSPSATFTITDDLGNPVTPISTTANSACFLTAAPRVYTVCAAPAGTGYHTPACQTVTGPAFGLRTFYTFQTPSVIRLTSSSEACNGGMYRNDDLTFYASCPYPVKPNGIDQPGYYGAGLFTIHYAENLGPYSPCVGLGGTTVYDEINGIVFYYFIPATAPGFPTGGYRLYPIPTNGTFPGFVSAGGLIGFNACVFPFLETVGGICGGFGGVDGYRMPLGGPACFLDDATLCNCFSGLCLDPAAPPCPGIGLPRGSFSLLWEDAT